MDNMATFGIILLQVIVGLLTGYLTYYVQQKSKNWADKEDLQALTDIVEEVKQKYQQDTEKLKADLAVLANRKTKNFSDEKESVILFYTAVNEWLWDKTNILIIDYDRDNFNDLSQKLLT